MRRAYEDISTQSLTEQLGNQAAGLAEQSLPRIRVLGYLNKTIRGLLGPVRLKSLQKQCAEKMAIYATVPQERRVWQLLHDAVREIGDPSITPQD